MKAFKGKIVYITGGSSGIGRAAAGLFAREGAHVVIFARNADRLQEAHAEVETKRLREGQRFAWYAVDITDEPAVMETMEQAVKDFGAPDLLVNSAGRAIPKYFEEITAEQFEETMKINVYGIRHTLAALLPHMWAKGGAVVNVSSVAGLIGVFGYTDYSASKFAVIGFSEALRSELKPLGIRVSVLCPPDTDTPGLEAENRTKPPETHAISKNAKMMQPEDVARAMMKGIRSNTFLIVPGFDSKLSVLAKRLLPGLVERIMDRAIAGCQQNEKREQS